MRRRLIIAALAIDTLCGIGGLILAPSVLAADGETTPDPARYVEVNGHCIEQDDAVEGAIGGWSVDPAFCAQS